MRSEWPLVRLGDHVDACLGKMLDAKKNRGELQPYLGNVNVRWGEFDLTDLAEMRFEPHEEARYSLLPGDLVVCEGGEPGRCAIWTGAVQRMKIQKALHRIRPKPSLDNYYLYYWFRHAANVGLLEPHFTGTTIKHLTGKAIAALQVPLPPVATQRAMVEVLRQLDDRIDLLRQTNATLEFIAQALFKSWFIDFDPVRAKAEGREPEGMEAETAALFPDEFEESALGLIPKGWGVARLGDMIELAYGKALKASDRRPGCVPVYGSGGITGYHDEALVKHASIVVGRKGTVGALHWEDAPFFPIDTTFYVKPKSAPLTFCFYAMQRLGLEEMNTDAAVPGLNRENAYRLDLVRPVGELLKAFDDLVGPLRDAMRVNGLRADTLVQIRDSLLPRLISGKLHLPAQEQSEPEGAAA